MVIYMVAYRFITKVIGELEVLVGQECWRDDVKVELDSIFELVNVTEGCSYL